jgi:peptidoglycan/xylan/chitin deacetylase (PgdA/CDA1 family)
MSSAERRRECRPVKGAFTALPLVSGLMAMSGGVVEMGMALIGVGARSWAVLGLLASASYGLTGPAAAANCPGNPDALGTSRTIIVDPREHPRIGTMQYSETLPLEDHEVVLTFDDGPIPKYSNQILDILAAQCVKATFFEIGRMAKEYPEGVRKLIAAGHSVGTHTQNHPLSMNHMPIERAKQEIDDGIASTKAALGDAAQLSPFFRIPGLLRAEVVEDYLASQGIQTWSADFPADDWRHVSSQKVHDLAISRIEAKGKGILLLHDIQARTVAALPGILRDLKAGGFRIVHVVAATPEMPKTPTEPQQWQLHPISETIAISHWPKIPSFVFASTPMLPAPAALDSELLDGRPIALSSSFGRSKRLARGEVPLPEEAPWPRQPAVAGTTNTTTLPAPAQTIFQIQEHTGPRVQASAPLQHRAERAPADNRPEADGIGRLISVDASAAKRTIPGSMPVTQPGLRPAPLTAR